MTEASNPQSERRSNNPFKFQKFIIFSIECFTCANLHALNRFSVFKQILITDVQKCFIIIVAYGLVSVSESSHQSVDHNHDQFIGQASVG